jgi:phospholipase/lecithinase/hemolysin
MKQQIAATGLFLFSVLLPIRAWAASFSQIYVFGDSLSDPGNDFNLSGSPPPPYFNGRFSNGPNWIDYLSQDLGLNPTPYTKLGVGGVIPTQGINFAFGGATTGTANTISTLLPALQQQVGLFQNFTQTYTPAADALYIVWA